MNPKSTARLADGSTNVFALCNAVARRARDLTDLQRIDKIVLPQKPLTVAVNEFNDGKLEPDVKKGGYKVPQPVVQSAEKNLKANDDQKGKEL